MNLILIALLLPFIPQQVAAPLAPYAESKEVVIDNLYLDERAGTLRLQSLRAADGQYFLRLTINTQAWGIKDPCKITLAANEQVLILPCFANGSIETVKGRLGVERWSILLLKDPKLSSFLEEASSVKLRIGRYKFSLRSDQLRALFTFSK